MKQKVKQKRRRGTAAIHPSMLLWTRMNVQTPHRSNKAAHYMHACTIIAVTDEGAVSLVLEMRKQNVWQWIIKDKETERQAMNNQRHALHDWRQRKARGRVRMRANMMLWLYSDKTRLFIHSLIYVFLYACIYVFSIYFASNLSLLSYSPYVENKTNLTFS